MVKLSGRVIQRDEIDIKRMDVKTELLAKQTKISRSCREVDLEEGNKCKLD